MREKQLKSPEKLQNWDKNQRQNYFIHSQTNFRQQVMKPYRKERIKFVKETSQGEKILSHSLLDMSEFQNIDQTYAKRKVTFNIAKRNVSFSPYVPMSEEQAQYDMTPKQKIQIYKKLNIKEKFNQGSIDKLKKIFKIRRSKIPNMLNNLGQTAKKQTQAIFEKQIRRSQQKLKFYRSQGKLNQDLLESPKKTIKQAETRCKFYSLKTGKPEMNERLFPTFEEFVEGRKRAKLQKKYEFNIQIIEKNLNTFCTEVEQNPEEQTEKMKGSYPLSLLAAMIGRASSTGSNRNVSQGLFSQRMVQSSTQNFKKRSRVQENLERFSESYIEKSERSSQKIVRTMTNFYSSKNSKKQEYNNMVEFYQHDRPLTNSIRRREYDFMKPQEKLKEITHYRKESQNKRQEILLFNSKTYKEILNSLSRYHEDDIPVSLEILRSMKHLMRREYLFGEDDVMKILRDIRNKSEQFLNPKKSIDQDEKKQDFMIQPVIDIINKAYSFNLMWIDL